MTTDIPHSQTTYISGLATLPTEASICSAVVVPAHKSFLFQYGATTTHHPEQQAARATRTEERPSNAYYVRTTPGK